MMFLTVKEENELKKEYLNKHKQYERKEKSLYEQMHKLQAMYRNAKSIEHSDMPNGNKHTDLSDYIVKLEHIQASIAKQQLLKNNSIIDIEYHIALMQDGIESDLLRKRYIEKKPWPVVARELGYTRDGALKAHGRALKHFVINIEQIKKQ